LFSVSFKFISRANKFIYSRFKMGTPTSIVCTIAVPSGSSTSCSQFGTNIYTANPLNFIQNALNTSFYFGKFGKSDMNKGKDWFRFESFPALNTTTPSGSDTNTCNLLLGYNFTVFYSEALVRNNSFIYLQYIRVTENRQSVALSSTSLALRHNFNYIPLPAQQLTAYEDFQKRFQTGFTGAVNSVFTKLIVPLLNPSSVTQV
jgi:hypothetical protein